MNSFLAPLERFAFALFRVVCGFLFLQFGTQKLIGWPNHPTPPGLTPLLVAAACIEFSCGLLVMIGLQTEIAALVACGEMAFAYFIGHFPVSIWPVVSKGVPAVLFCFSFLLIACRGAGTLSLDSVLKKQKGP